MLRFLAGCLVPLMLPWLLIVGSPALASDESSATLAAYVKANPLEIKLTLSDDHVAVGERFVIDVSVKNRGDIALREVEFTLHVIESPCLKVSGPLTHYRGLLQGGRSASHAWRVQAIEGGPGCRSIVVVASATAVDQPDGGTVKLESQAQLLEIR